MEWLARFHGGERSITEQVYREFLDTVDRGVAAVLHGADRETVVHEVFLRLLTDGDLRRAFQGGDLGAWLLVIARNHAIDYARRRNRETPSGLDIPAAIATARDGLAGRAEARLLLDRFWTELLPPKWRAVFEARFVRNLSQTEAAAALDMHRTTLMYQELRIRQLLRAFLLEEVS